MSPTHSARRVVSDGVFFVTPVKETYRMTINLRKIDLGLTLENVERMSTACFIYF